MGSRYDICPTSLMGLSLSAMNKPIYLDYAATTPTDPVVIEAMHACLQNTFGNPASRTHGYGSDAAKLVAIAREQVAAFINASPSEITWTSGATEANNLAIKGIAQFHDRRGKHLITVASEHHAVLDVFHTLASQGYDVTILPVQKNGLLDLDSLKNALRDDTILVSVMHVNNETGVIQNIEAIGNLLRERGIFFHVDAAQSIGKVLMDVKRMPIDLLSMSAHKIYGPKGIGALYISGQPKIRLEAQIHGGGQENGVRAGTLATHQILGMGLAFDLASEYFHRDALHIKKLSDLFLKGVMSLAGVHRNGEGLPSIINLSFEKVAGESLLLAFKDIAVSTGSACSSARMTTSHVLQAMDVPSVLQHSAIRFSFGRFTTEAQVLQAIDVVRRGVAHLRRIAPG